MMKQAKNIPELRFPGFEGEWENKKIKDLGEIITGSTPPTSHLEFYGGDHLFVSPVDIKDNRYVQNTVTTLTKLGLSKGRLIKKNSAMFVCIGSTIGKIAQTTRECITNQQINSIVSKSTNDADFIYSLLEKEAPNIKKLAAEQAVPIINKTTFSNVSVITPSLPEQQKIASFLSAADQRIQLLTQKKEKLEQYKKGIMQQIFSQQLRFKDENGHEYPEWEEKRLGEVAVFYDSKRIPLSDSERSKRKGPYPYYGASGIIDYLNDFIFDGEFVLLGEDGANIISRNSKLAFVVKGKFWVNNHAHILQAKGSNIFLAETLERIRFEKYNTGTVQPKLNIDVCKKIVLNIPIKQEQQKIASFLSSIDQKITLVNQQIELTRKWKQGLLQKLFV